MSFFKSKTATVIVQDHQIEFSLFTAKESNEFGKKYSKADKEQTEIELMEIAEMLANHCVSFDGNREKKPDAEDFANLTIAEINHILKSIIEHSTQLKDA